MKVVRRSFLFQALAGVLSLLGLNPYATAWGLQRDLAENWGKAHLVFAALQRKEIRYCIQISDPAKFPLSSIRAQAVQALRLWMSATHEPATVTELDCVDKRFDIKFQIGPESIYPTLSSYQIIVREQGHDYSLVKINTDFRAEFRGQKFAIVDFATLVGGESRLPAVMDEVSVHAPTDIRALSCKSGIAYMRLYLSTYSMFIHELGHSFGLCDTYEGEAEKQCDPALSSRSQPSSVMQDSDLFYLTEDDTKGVRELFATSRNVGQR